MDEHIAQLFILEGKLILNNNWPLIEIWNEFFFSFFLLSFSSRKNGNTEMVECLWMWDNAIVKTLNEDLKSN